MYTAAFAATFPVATALTATALIATWSTATEPQITVPNTSACIAPIAALAHCSSKRQSKTLLHISQQRCNSTNRCSKSTAPPATLSSTVVWYQWPHHSQQQHTQQQHSEQWHHQQLQKKDIKAAYLIKATLRTTSVTAAPSKATAEPEFIVTKHALTGS